MVMTEEKEEKKKKKKKGPWFRMECWCRVGFCV